MGWICLWLMRCLDVRLCKQGIENEDNNPHPLETIRISFLPHPFHNMSSICFVLRETWIATNQSGYDNNLHCNQLIDLEFTFFFHRKVLSFKHTFLITRLYNISRKLEICFRKWNPDGHSASLRKPWTMKWEWNYSAPFLSFLYQVFVLIEFWEDGFGHQLTVCCFKKLIYKTWIWV